MNFDLNAYIDMAQSAAIVYLFVLNYLRAKEAEALR